MNINEESPQEEVVPTQNKESSSDEGKTPEDAEVVASELQLEEAKQAELLAKDIEALTENAMFTKAADFMLNKIDDNMAMDVVRKPWDALPEEAQDAFLAARRIPNPLISLYPAFTKLLTDLEILQRKGGADVDKVAESIQSDRRFDELIAKTIKVFPEAEVVSPIIEQIRKSKEAVRTWIGDRRSTLNVERQKRKNNEQISQDAEKESDIRDQIGSA
jgi:hypothetical protein